MNKLLIILMTSVWMLSATEEQNLIAHVQQSIARSSSRLSRLSPSILRIHGMSSSKVRHFLNNVCSMPGTSYLEIGTWAGSTLISALYKNQSSIKQAIAIDNWSEFMGPREQFLRNTARYLPQGSFIFHEMDSFAFDIDSIPAGSINIYFYDGNHSQESQRKAFTYFNDLFADVFIAIVDDWNDADVQAGTRQAFAELKYTILFEQALPARFIGDRKFWWNGLYVAVIKKSLSSDKGC